MLTGIDLNFNGVYDSCETISYDNIGNPTSYLGAILNWTNRELQSYTKDGKTVEFKYDVNGMRYQKEITENGVTENYDYIYSEDAKLLATRYTKGSTNFTATFIYDSNGEPQGFLYNGNVLYLYLKNLQGDIVGITNSSGTIVATYTYDAWGNFTVSPTASGFNSLLNNTLKKISPFAYRGYCYDFDLGLYYLQSRYYDPITQRFINADSTDYLGATETVLSYNLFAYCENDPVNFVDPSGYANVWNWTVYGYPISYVCKNFDDVFTYNPNIRPTAKDRKNWKTWGRLSKTAALACPEGSAFYEYYRSAQGGYYYDDDYTKACKQDNSIKKAVNKMLNYLKMVASLFVQRYDEWFFISTEQNLVKCSSLNWKLALGGHYVGIKACIMYESKNDLYILIYNVIAIDRYNFDGNGKKFYGIPDSVNARFVTLGWAKFFTSYGTMLGVKIWKE